MAYLCGTAAALVLLTPAPAPGIFFAEAEIPGLRVSAVNPLSGHVVTNYRQADLDGDGKRDVLLPAEVFFQRAGGFPPENRAPMPGAAEQPACDLWDGAIYLWFSGKLRVVRWAGGGWNTLFEQELARPDPTREHEAFYVSEGRAGVRFARFLHDLDEDANPEIIVAGEAGIHLYRQVPPGNGEKRDSAKRSGEGAETGQPPFSPYAEAACLDVLPPLRFVRPPGQALWPPKARQMAFPARAMRCRFLIEGNKLTTIVREEGPGLSIRYRLSRYTIELPPESPAPSPITSITAPLPPHFRPCRLNGDDLIDYAGGDWELSTSSPLPMPIYETSASIDNGKTVQSVRSVSFRPLCSFIDFDGDGDRDMIAETMGLFDGGIRECISRGLTSKRLDHEIAVHLQDAGGVFSKSPDIRGRFTVRLDAPPLRGSALFQRYQSSELFDISGDFNGDRRRDIVVHERPGRLAVYLCGDRGFSTQPDGAVDIPEGAHFGVADIDGDGRGDIAVRWYVSAGNELEEHGRVYLTRDGAGEGAP